MIDGIGVDIVDIERFKTAMENSGQKFLERVFTKREIEYSQTKKFPHQHFAARFATKEAVFKAFGGGKSSIRKWTDMEVLNDEHGKPYIELHNQAKEIYEQKNIKDILISMSHSHNSAVAHVVLVRLDQCVSP